MCYFALTTHAMGIVQMISVYGESANLKGSVPKEGDPAPEVRVVASNYQDIVIGGAKDKPQLILTVPTLDGEVCPQEIERFDEILGEFGPHVYTYVVSMDIPHAQKRYCIIYSIRNLEIFSDFRYRDLEKYGVLIDSGMLKGLLARAAFIVDKEGKIRYMQLVKEQTHEPDYDEIRAALEKVISQT
ncbi:MAG: thiol peroxidase [Bacteroidia bacterium]|nr:thiol peroxidase [Bacteroidia bacterium]